MTQYEHWKRDHDRTMEAMDILAEWKNKRFVIVDSKLHDYSNHIILLSDYMYWSDNMLELVEWCHNNNCKLKGMTIEIPNDSLLTMFILRWT